MKSKKGLAALSGLPSGVLMFAVAFIILAFVAILLQSLQTTQTPTNASGSWVNNESYDILTNSLAGADAIGDQGANIGLVVVIVVIIGLLVGGFGYLMGKRQ